MERFVDALKDLIDIHERRLSAFESFVSEAVLYLLAGALAGPRFWRAMDPGWRATAIGSRRRCTRR